MTAFGPGRKHSLLPALATNVPPARLLNASRPFERELGERGVVGRFAADLCHSEELCDEESRPNCNQPRDPSLALRMTARGNAVGPSMALSVTARPYTRCASSPRWGAKRRYFSVGDGVLDVPAGKMQKQRNPGRIRSVYVFARGYSIVIRCAVRTGQAPFSENQPFTEPAVTPLMMDLERMMYTTSTGRIASRMNMYTLPMSNLE